MVFGYMLKLDVSLLTSAYNTVLRCRLPEYHEQYSWTKTTVLSDRVVIMLEWSKTSILIYLSTKYNNDHRDLVLDAVTSVRIEQDQY
jgi:hypothetical protein